MALKRKPRKQIRISEAARRIGCSKESIRTGAVGGFQTFKLNDKQTSPLMCYEAEVAAFIENTEKRRHSAR
jgi:hypothetical protein